MSNQFNYEVNADNELRVWNKEQEAPFLFQPHYPNGDAWTADQATAWAELFVNSLEDPNSELVPGPSAAEPSAPRPVPTEPEPAPAE